MKLTGKCWFCRRPIKQGKFAHQTCQKIRAGKSFTLIKSGIRRKYKNYSYGYKDKDTLQPFMKDGTVNKEYVQAYGTKTLEREFKTSKQAIMKEIERYG